MSTEAFDDVMRKRKAERTKTMRQQMAVNTQQQQTAPRFVNEVPQQRAGMGNSSVANTAIVDVLIENAGRWALVREGTQEAYGHDFRKAGCHVATRSRYAGGVKVYDVYARWPMTIFDELRPAGWTESLDDTMRAIEEEGTWHNTEQEVSEAFEDSDVSQTLQQQTERTVSKLRARAVVLAAEVERLREFEWMYGELCR